MVIVKTATKKRGIAVGKAIGEPHFSISILKVCDKPMSAIGGYRCKHKVKERSKC